MKTGRAQSLGLTAMLVLGPLFLTGCFSSSPEDIQAFAKPYEVNVTEETYVTQPPDELLIVSSRIPEINNQRQMIRPDGKISFEALGEIDVAGKTLGEIAKILQEKVKELYTLPGDNAVDVRVSAFRSKVYYVLGQVDRPGPRVYSGRASVLMALAEAQPNAMAWEQKVQVVRPTPDPGADPMIFAVNYNKMIAHGDTSKDVLLQEGDIVYVPPTILASAAMVIEEFIRPIARAFYGAYLVQNPPIETQQGYYPRGGGGY